VQHLVARVNASLFFPESFSSAVVPTSTRTGRRTTGPTKTWPSTWPSWWAKS